MSIRLALEKARSFLAALAPITPIKSDDALVVVIDALLADAGLFGWFEGKVADNVGGVLSLESTPPIALQVTLEARKIDWAKLIEMVPTIISLLKLFRG